MHTYTFKHHKYSQLVDEIHLSLLKILHEREISPRYSSIVKFKCIMNKTWKN